MAKRSMCIRVVLRPDQMENTELLRLLECLRYAGVVRIHDKVGSGHPEAFDILPPKGVDSMVWADQNAQRMQTFDFNAVDAPEWK